MTRNNIRLLSFVLVSLSISLFLLWKGITGDIQTIENTPTPAPANGVLSATTDISATDSSMEAKNYFRVNRVVDGDTIEVIVGGEIKSVRFIGINTPETVDPRRPVQCFGTEASNKTKELLSGKWVYLEKDISDTDKYNRLLRYVFLPLDNGEKLFVNDYLVREGYANAISYPPDVKYAEQFKSAENQARENNKGLYNKCKK